MPDLKFLLSRSSVEIEYFHYWRKKNYHDKKKKSLGITSFQNSVKVKLDSSCSLKEDMFVFIKFYNKYLILPPFFSTMFNQILTCKAYAHLNKITNIPFDKHDD